MSKALVRESLYLERQLDTELQTVPSQNKAKYSFFRLTLIISLVTSMFLVGLFQIKLYSRIVLYKQEITALEDSIRDLTIKNEELKKEVENLSSPTRLSREAERLGLQPSNRLLELPMN